MAFELHDLILTDERDINVGDKNLGGLNITLEVKKL